ncbi:hypothetical protein [Streptomyces sp. NPDC096012]|uniref:hypothetical protein n=1 Tax=Streptomyces sp. NPDC096012 TaxID=3155684 RepID=UPI00336A3371
MEIEENVEQRAMTLLASPPFSPGRRIPAIGARHGIMRSRPQTVNPSTFFDGTPAALCAVHDLA